MPVQELIIANRMPVASTEIGQGNRILSLSAELGLEQQVGGTMGLTANTVAFSSEREDTRATMEAGADLHLGDFASLFVRSSFTTAFSGADHSLEENAGVRERRPHHPHCRKTVSATSHLVPPHPE